ncbi:ATP-binding protein [Rhizobacter sp. OV335]|uniref:ATP-binding protein n=1 Tax=Rhizobacter sp. OV335 TaxID=1500264 RepID=UPI000913A5D9|nr:ATP-binding protein [Rhizobacter sp. OV335]SHN18413.1 ATPase family associated with various cellular activities (AAA) [Rhizobacter sp. OV335]
MSSGADLRLLRVELNARVVGRELAWLERVLQARISLHFGQGEAPSAPAMAAPALGRDDGDYAELVHAAGLEADERLVLALAVAPHLKPQLLDMLFVRNRNLDRGFSEFGGWKGRSHGGFLPTCETAAFLVAGEDMAHRFALQRLLDEDRPLRRHGLLRLQHDGPGEPWLSAALHVSGDTLERLATGESRKPDYGIGFPARLITTRLGWSDLVLDGEVMDEVQAIVTWYRHGQRLLRDWRLDKALKPGYRSLFYGPPGTGKTLTATLIGQEVGSDVYRIDLSMVVSKFIGETEKNLAQVFDQAQSRQWILFFDEADALFGKRTATSSSNDRYANQEVSYLLQRVEDFPGTVILATNLKANIDDAFARRFQSLVHFPMPDAEQRRLLWEGMVRHTGRLGDDVDLQGLAERHELSGGAIANVVRFGALGALQAGRERIEMADLRRGVAKELRKEGRTA